MPLLLVLFIVVPLVELYVILQVGQAIGVLPTIGLLIADSILGSLLMRSQGRAVWRRFNEALARNRPPASEVIDGAFVLVGGALLLTPGFTTDIVGLLCLLPPTRAVLRRALLRGALRRVLIVTPGGRGAASRARMGDVVEGTAREVDP